MLIWNVGGFGVFFIWGSGLLCLERMCDQAHSAVCHAPPEAVSVWSNGIASLCLGWSLSLNLAPPRSVMHGWGGLGWFQPHCLDTRSGSSFVDTRDYRYLISLLLLIISPGSSACCSPVSSAERRHFLRQIPQPVNLWLGSCGKLQANNSWCSWTFH